MAFVDDIFLALKARPSCRFFLTYLAGFVTLSFRGVGMGCEQICRDAALLPLDRYRQASQMP